MAVFCAACGCNSRRSIESRSRGITFHNEKQLLAHYLSKNMSKEAQKKIKTYTEKLQRALESEDFLKRL